MLQVIRCASDMASSTPMGNEASERWETCKIIERIKPRRCKWHEGEAR